MFSVLIGNADMHLKNWSLLYPDKRSPVLSPAYDFVATRPYFPKDTLALNFGSSSSLSEFTRDQMRRFADTARIPTSPLWQIAADTAEPTVAAWKTLEQKELLPKDMTASIEKQIHALAATVTANAGASSRRSGTGCFLGRRGWESEPYICFNIEDLRGLRSYRIDWNPANQWSLYKNVQFHGSRSRARFHRMQE